MTTTFDVVANFNHTGVQPAAGYPFTYGTETALNVGFTLLPYFVNTNHSGLTGESTTGGTMDNWYFQYQLAGPAVGVVATGGTLTFLPNSTPFVIPNDVLMMMAGSPDYAAAPDLLVTRFTAPSAGLFDLTVSFTDLQIAGVGLAIVVNGTTVWNSSFTGNSPYQGTISFSFSGLSLAQGATIDFVVDSLGHQAFDVLGLKALITEHSPNPVMLNAVFNAANNLTTLSGTAEANSSVSVFDGNKPVGTVTAAADGTWSLQANVAGNVIHSFTETSTLGADTASSAGVTLYTPAANKLLQGGSGNDVLIGAPNDTLTGGLGADTFVFNPSFGKETVTGYIVNQDVLAFSHTLFTNDTASQVLSQTHDSKAGAVIVVDAQDTITLVGVPFGQEVEHVVQVDVGEQP